MKIQLSCSIDSITYHYIDVASEDELGRGLNYILEHWPKHKSVYLRQVVTSKRKEPSTWFDDDLTITTAVVDQGISMPKRKKLRITDSFESILEKYNELSDTQ